MEHKDNEINPIDGAAGSPAPPSSSNGRVTLIKLKYTKQVGEAMEEVKSHYCKECNKSFSSGKALGGHMSSAHVQANKDYSAKKMSSKRKSSGSNSGNACELCGRVFQSKKSLFGHMRSHPEREWRGMEPPPEFKADSADASDDDDDDDEDGRDQIDSAPELGFDLKKWPTSKRGRGPITTVRETKETGSFVAGLELIKMLKGKENQKSETLASNSIDPNDELYLTAIDVLMNGNRGNQKKTVVAVEEKAEVITGGGGSPETASSSPEKYKCNECGRLFSTHQALGGHRSSHNKFKLDIVNTIPPHQSEPSPSPSPLKRKKKTKKVEKIANNNVAGDGDGDMGTSSAERAVVAASASASAFAFDLNMAPAEEEDFEDSSNHNSSDS